MKPLLPALAVFAVLSATNGFSQDRPTALITAIKPSAHIELFNGTNLADWTFVARSNAAAAGTWSVSNGVIHCAGRPAGYARTVKEYCEYKLTVEWRFVKVAPKADNTGIFLHINPPDKVWPTCIECQGQSGRQGELRLNGDATCRDHLTPDARQLSSSQPANEKPVGEWNTLQAECSGDAIKLFINGKLMNEASGCSVVSGAIGIQSEGGEIEVRKIFIEPLPAR